MKIDSVSVIPAGTKDLPSVFSADTRNLSDVRNGSLLLSVEGACLSTYHHLQITVIGNDY